MKRFMKHFISVAMTAVLVLSLSLAGVSAARAEEEQYKEGTYDVTAQFWNAANDTLSSANGTIVSSQVTVDKAGNLKVQLALQAAQGMNFYDFQYEDKEGNYQNTEVVTTDEDGNPAVISFVLPDDSGWINMKTTYPNPVMGPHTVSVRLSLDLDNIPKYEEEVEDDLLAAGTYDVAAQFYNAANESLSSADGAIKSAGIQVNKDTTMKVSLYLQTVNGMDFYDFAYETEDGSYQMASVEERDPSGNPIHITFTIPQQEYTNMKTTYPNPVMGPHTVSVRLYLDLANAVQSEGDGQEPGGEDNNGEDNEGDNQEGDGNEADNGGSNGNSEEGSDNSSEEILGKDGIYEVDVKLYHASKEELSMAAGTVADQARIAVTDGVATMYIYTQPMTMGTIKAALQSLKVETAAGSSEYKEAAIMTYDSNGDPSSFAFQLPHTEDYMNVKVNPQVAIMGNVDVDARIKVDWTSLKEMADNTDLTKAPSFTTPANTTVAGAAGTGATGLGTTVNTGDTTQTVFLILAMLTSMVLAAASIRSKKLGKVTF